ncbi:MAG: hypothetical protein ACE14P_14070 [Methanotrichaceae archaeon]
MERGETTKEQILEAEAQDKSTLADSVSEKVDTSTIEEDGSTKPDEQAEDSPF